MKTKFKLFESPDEMVDNGKLIHFGDIDALAFAFIDGRNFYFEEFSDIHPNFDFFYLDGNYYDIWDRLEFAGRLWFRKKIISFWEYPKNKQELNKLINKINENIDKIKKQFYDQYLDELAGKEEPIIYKQIKKIDNSWKIEIIIDEDEEKKSNLNDKYYGGEDGRILIPISEFKKSKDASKEEREEHWKSPMKKTRKKEYQKSSKWKKWQKPFENKLYESPNSAIGILPWAEIGNIVFGYFLDDTLKPKLKYLENGTKYVDIDKESRNYTHTDLFNYYSSSNDVDLFGGRTSWSGRIFKDAKIITFWDFPKDKEQLKKICKDIEEETWLDIWNDDWKIEVYENENELGVDWEDYHPETKLIPIKDFIQSNKIPKEEFEKEHEISPMKKDIKKKYIKNKPIEWQNALGKYRGETKISKFKNFLNESPDSILDDNMKTITDFANIDALAFSLDKNDKLYYDLFQTIHPDFIELSENEMKYPGRLWFREKLISFWEYPENKQILDDIIKQINDNIEDIRKIDYAEEWRTTGSIEPFEINPIDDTWQIEVFTNPEFNKIYNYGLKYGAYGFSKLIPISQYKSSLNPSEEREEHLKSPMKKKKRVSTSKKTDIKWKNALGKWRGESVISYKDFKLNENPDKIRIDGNLIAHHENDDALPFGILDGYFYFEDFNMVHPMFEISPKEMSYTGRIWFEKKIISFWQYPENKEKLDFLIDEINSNIDEIKDLDSLIEVDYIDDSWKIEIIDDTNVDDTKYDWENPYGGPEIENEKYKVIPISQYKSSLNPSEEEREEHWKSPMKKSKKIKPYYKDKPIEYKHALGKWRGENLIQKFNIYNNKNNKNYDN